MFPYYKTINRTNEAVYDILVVRISLSIEWSDPSSISILICTKFDLDSDKYFTVSVDRAAT